jgi:hypothetical protein
MVVDSEEAADPEPPSGRVPDEGACAALLERVMAACHAAPEAHVAVIGHHTLPFVLALLRRGCISVRSVRPGAPAPDCEPVELAWIVDLQNRHELGDALRAARSRVGPHGRIVVEGTACRWRNALAGLTKDALAAGLDVIAADRQAHRLVLIPSTRLAMAA